MGWLSPAPPRPKARVTRAVTAAAAKVDVTDARSTARIKKVHQEWQAQAWAYMPLVGEYRFSVGFVRHSIAKVRLFAAGQPDPAQDPVPVMDLVEPVPATDDNEAQPAWLDAKLAAAAEEALARLATGEGGQSEILERLAGNLFVAGDAYLVGREVTVTPARLPSDEAPLGAAATTEERWEVRSEAEVIVKDGSPGESNVRLARHPGDTEGEVLPAGSFLLRIWHADLQFGHLADSNVKAALPILEELVALGQSVRAAHRSRLSAGMLFVPEELSFGPADGVAGELGEDEFEHELMVSMTTPIEDEGDASAVVPLVIRGPGDLGEKIRLIELGRKVTAEDTAREEALVRRLARTIDLPVEKVLGSQQTTFANAEQIDKDTYDEHLSATVEAIVAALTHGYLRPSLLSEGFDPDAVAKVVIGTDLSDLVTESDPGPAADTGHDNGALSDDAWRRAHGFTDTDAPSDEERLRRLAIDHAILTGPATILLLEQAGLVPAGTAEALAALGPEAEAEAAPPEPDAAPAEEAPAQDGQDAEEAASVAAAATRRTGLGTPLSELADADRALQERLLVAADAEMASALSRAGARLRSLAQRDPALRASIDGVPNHLVAAVAGPDGVERLSQADASDLLRGAFTGMAARWDRWVGATQEVVPQAVEAHGGTLSDEDRQELAAAQEDDRAAGWTMLLGGLVALATARLFNPDPGVPDVGEYDTTLSVPPVTVRAALATAGGERTVAVSRAGGVSNASGVPPGGVTTGTTAQAAFARAGIPWRGYRWVYGDASARRQPFPPHQALDGRTFRDWDHVDLSRLGDDEANWMETTSYYPGDHAGCRCTFEPVTGTATTLDSP